MLSALILWAAQALSPQAAAAVQDANDRLLAGESLPPGHVLQLQALPPDQRLLVLVHLRRAGLLVEAPRDPDWLLAPAADPLPEPEK